MVRGHATVLYPDQKDAKVLNKGMPIYNDSSVLTSTNSLVIVDIIDGSKVTVGPESKFVIYYTQKRKQTLIQLLKGQVRAQVEKALDLKNKFYIHTRTASIGVRGTDFVSSYYPETERTSVSTYEGVVAFKKNEVSTEEKLKDLPLETKVALVHKNLERKEIELKMGEFSNIDTGKDSVLSKRAISVDQLVILEKDQSFGLDKINLNAKELAQLKSNKLNELKKDNNSYFKLKVGLVDNNSGFIIPKGIGKIDSNGKYISPNNFKVDKDKGLIPTDNSKNIYKDQLKDQTDNKSNERENPSYKRFYMD